MANSKRKEGLVQQVKTALEKFYFTGSAGEGDEEVFITVLLGAVCIGGVFAAKGCATILGFGG